MHKINVKSVQVFVLLYKYLLISDICLNAIMYHCNMCGYYPLSFAVYNDNNILDGDNK